MQNIVADTMNENNNTSQVSNGVSQVFDEYISQEKGKLYNKINYLIKEFEQKQNCWIMIDYSEKDRFMIVPFVYVGIPKGKYDNTLESIHMIHRMNYDSWKSEIES